MTEAKNFMEETMALTINTNVASLNAQRNLAKSQGDLATSMQRLSSGLRINSSKDDAAGLAISDRMTSQIRGLDQASRNANDAISLAQTAEGAMQESTNILQRMRELAVQAANATNSASDRQSLQAEVDQLNSELDRIAKSTTFNGLKVLDGSYVTQQFQVGPNAGDTIGFDITGIKANSIGHLATAVGLAVNGTTATDNTITLGSTGTAQTIKSSANYAVTGDTYRGADSAFAKVAAINDAGVFGLLASASTSGTSAAVAGGTVAPTLTAYSLTVNGVKVIDIPATNVPPVTDAQVVTAINQNTDKTGVTASVDVNHKITLTAADGENIALAETGPAAVISGTLTATTRGTISMTANDSITVGGTVANLGMNATPYAVDALKGVDVIDITSLQGANEAMLRVDAAIASVDASRGKLGAIQNRFESTIANLQNVSENLTAARSRIKDADIAQETSNMTKANILQQAGVSILTQANQIPQLALSLLKG